MSSTSGRRGGSKGRGSRSVQSGWRLIVGMMAVAYCLLMAAGPGAGVGMVMAQGGPNDPPATIDPNDPDGMDPTPTPWIPEGQDPNAPEPTPTPWIPDGQEPEETIPPVGNPQPGPPPTAEPPDLEMPEDVRVPKVTIPTAPMVDPSIMTATIRITGMTCPRDGYDPYLRYPAWDSWATNCTEPAAYIFGVTVNRVYPATSYSRSLSVAAGAVGEVVVDAPSWVQFQALKSGIGATSVRCTDALGAMRWHPLDVEPGDVLDCIFYVVPLDDDVTINGWIGVCDASPALRPGQPLPSPDQLATLCRHSVFAGVPVTITATNASGSVTQSATTVGASYSAGRERDEYSLLDLPPGVYSLSVTVPTGYAYAFLDHCDPVGATSPSPVSGVPSPSTVNASPGGRTISCTWFLVRAS